MWLDLQRDDVTGKGVRVCDHLYGKTFSLHEILVDFLNNPLDKYIDPLYWENNKNAIHFDLIYKKEIDFEQYKTYRLMELINQYIKDYSLDKLHEFKDDFTLMIQENFSDRELTTPHIFHSDVLYSITLSNGLLSERYEATNIAAYCLLVLSKLIDSDIKLKRCENCGIFFLPENRLEKYCDNIFEDGKTCKEVGPFIKRRNNDTVKKYRQLQTNLQYHIREKGLRVEAEFWKEFMSRKYKLFKNGEMSDEDFLDLALEAFDMLKKSSVVEDYIFKWAKDKAHYKGDPDLDMDEYNEILKIAKDNQEVSKGGKG